MGSVSIHCGGYDSLMMSYQFLFCVYLWLCPQVTLKTLGEVYFSDFSSYLSSFIFFPLVILPLFWPSTSRHQQYECKWYIPLADLTFQTLDDSDSCPNVQIVPEHEIEEMKIKISVLKSEIQKEKVI